MIKIFFSYCSFFFFLILQAMEIASIDIDLVNDYDEAENWFRRQT